MPWIWILAGPNGSGKTTIAREPKIIQLTAGNPSLNADDVAKVLAEAADTPVTPEISLQAARSVDAAVAQHVKDGASFTVETVLSSPKYKPTVKEARKAGFNIGLIFVFTSRADLNVLRISQRSRPSPAFLSRFRPSNFRSTISASSSDNSRPRVGWSKPSQTRSPSWSPLQWWPRATVQTRRPQSSARRWPVTGGPSQRPSRSHL